ncbi:MAG: FAD-dependent oxidoreductase, partial [Bryobacteraceae bacterium]
MPARLNLDVLIIGGGQAGIPLAYALVKGGRKVALAESKDLGGSCVNFGCTPTKAAIASAKVAHMARRASDFGLRIPTVEVDFEAVIQRARGVALESRGGLDRGFAKAGGNPELFRGHARFTGREAERFLLSAGSHEIAASQVVLDTGTRSTIPSIPGLAGIDFLTSENWLDHTELPRHLAIIGAGYIGLEMGQFYRRMGSEVTLLDHGDGLLSREDRDVSDALRDLLAAEGIHFELGAKIQHIEKRGNDIVLTCPGTETVATDLFIATGRAPNTDDLGLETVGVETDSHGIVKVDERLATNVEGVWAAGDIRGGPM